MLTRLKNDLRRTSRACVHKSASRPALIRACLLAIRRRASLKLSRMLCATPGHAGCSVQGTCPPRSMPGLAPRIQSCTFRLSVTGKLPLPGRPPPRVRVVLSVSAFHTDYYWPEQLPLPKHRQKTFQSPATPSTAALPLMLQLREA